MTRIPFPTGPLNALRRSLPAAAMVLSAGLTPAQAAPAAADPLRQAAAEPGAVLTPSGMVYQALTEGSGNSPAATDTVRVHYRGYFPGGKEFDSSIKRGKPATFPLDRVIPCWTEGLQRMKPGGKARLTCPPALAYGERGAGDVIPPNAVLQFEVELLGLAIR